MFCNRRLLNLQGGLVDFQTVKCYDSSNLKGGNPMNLGENIYRHRTARNLSQGDLADALDVSRQSVSKWENNSAVPELDKLMKMAELFGITLDALVTGVKPELPAPPPRPMPQTSKIAGLFLLGLGLIASLLILILAIYTNGGLLPILYALPLIPCGILCLCGKPNGAFFAGVLLYMAIWTVITLVPALS